MTLILPLQMGTKWLITWSSRVWYKI